MKRFLSVLLTVAMLISTVQFVAFAESAVLDEGTCGAAVTWKLTEDGTLTISGSGAMEAYSCPWLEFPSSIRNVEFSDGITSIPESAFSYCSNLESVHLPEQLQEIPQRAFYSCKALTEIVIPAGVMKIGYEAFIYCSNLTSITFLGDPPQFGRYAFSGVTATVYHDINNSNWPPSSSTQHYGSFTYATYGEPATSGICGDDARWEYADGVLTITGTGAIYDYYRDEVPWRHFRDELHTVVVGEGITDIGYYAFFECAALMDVTLPSTLKTIRYAAFAECTGLKEIDIPEGVTEVGGGAYAFSGCTSLERISLPSTLERISTGCFRNCSSLKEIDIPEGIVSFGEEAFYGCTSLKTVDLPEGMTTINPGLFSNSGVTELKIPSTVEVIGDAFDNCVNLKEITIPASVTYIRQYTFADSTSLEQVVFEGDAPELCNNIFRNVTATVWYPADNATWTEEVMQQYGGTITWKSYHNGDINGDGAVNNKDATRLFQYLSGWDVEICFAALDVNGDGEVNNKDATRLFQYLSGWNVEIH